MGHEHNTSEDIHTALEIWKKTVDVEASRAIADALAPGHHEIWNTFLDHNPVTEGVADLEAAPSVRALLRAPGHERYSLESRLRAIQELRDRMYDPDADADPVDNLLFAIYSALVNLLKSNLLTLVANGAPPSGHLMYFTSRLHRCLVIVYEVLNTSTVYIAIESSIPNPKTVFDVFDNIDKLTPRARNVLKAMLASGHKIVGHRNALVHIDRRNDTGVFGPAIDTLYLNELLYKYLYEYERLDQPKLDFFEVPELSK